MSTTAKKRGKPWACYGCGSERSRLFRWLSFRKCPECRAQFCSSCLATMGVRIRGENLLGWEHDKATAYTCTYCEHQWTEEITYTSS